VAAQAGALPHQPPRTPGGGRGCANRDAVDGRPRRATCASSDLSEGLALCVELAHQGQTSGHSGKSELGRWGGKSEAPGTSRPRGSRPEKKKNLLAKPQVSTPSTTRNTGTLAGCSSLERGKIRSRRVTWSDGFRSNGKWPTAIKNARRRWALLPYGQLRLVPDENPCVAHQGTSGQEIRRGGISGAPVVGRVGWARW